MDGWDGIEWILMIGSIDWSVWWLVVWFFVYKGDYGCCGGAMQKEKYKDWILRKVQTTPFLLNIWREIYKLYIGSYNKFTLL